MKRAIWPAGLALLALVLTAAAPAPDVRAAPPRTVPHGEAARPRVPLPSALRTARSAVGPRRPRSRSTGRTTSSSGPTTARAPPRCTALASARAEPCSIRTDSRSPRPKARNRQSPSTAPTTSSSGEPGIRSSGRASIRPGQCSIPAGYRSRRGPTSSSEPTPAFDGTNYLVVWVTATPETDVYGARVSPSGTVLDPAGIEIGEARDCSTCLRSPSTGRTTSSSGRKTRATASWAGESAKAGSRTATVAS